MSWDCAQGFCPDAQGSGKHAFWGGQRAVWSRKPLGEVSLSPPAGRVAVGLADPGAGAASPQWEGVRVRAFRGPVTPPL